MGDTLCISGAIIFDKLRKNSSKCLTTHFLSGILVKIYKRKGEEQCLQK